MIQEDNQLITIHGIEKPFKKISTSEANCSFMSHTAFSKIFMASIHRTLCVRAVLGSFMLFVFTRTGKLFHCIKMYVAHTNIHAHACSKWDAEQVCIAKYLSRFKSASNLCARITWWLCGMDLNKLSGLHMLLR